MIRLYSSLLHIWKCRWRLGEHQSEQYDEMGQLYAHRKEIKHSCIVVHEPGA
jgi:hypothetical protein